MTDPTPAEVDVEELMRLADWAEGRGNDAGSLGVANGVGGRNLRVLGQGTAVVIARLRAAEHRAAELAAQNAVLRAAVEPFAKMQYHREDEITEQWDGFIEEAWVQTARTALATTPAEALACVREMQERLEKAGVVIHDGLQGSESFIDSMDARAVFDRIGEAIDAARRLFGSAR